jgi:pimeloyl-ACP methyl ester carboxylesterase
LRVTEQLTDVGRGVEICHESFGDPSDPPMLLLMGLATQMVAWHEDFCNELVGRGFHVIRMDNRDTGRSTHFPDVPEPTLRQMIRRRFDPRQYDLDDMAEDTAGLIEALGLGPVHLVGASMGGMIGQVLAARRPELVRSFASIMSNTGSRVSGQPALGVMRLLLAQAPRGREEFIEHAERLFGVIGTQGEERGDIEAIAAMHFERGVDPASGGRQLGAVLKSGNRTRLLRRIKAPTVVIHGTADKLVRPSGGRAAVRLIPGARLIKVPGMGHDLPRSRWPLLIDAIVANTRKTPETKDDAAATRAAA